MERLSAPARRQAGTGRPAEYLSATGQSSQVQRLVIKYLLIEQFYS